MQKLSGLFQFLRMEKGLALVTIGNINYFVLSGLLWLYLASLLNAEDYGELNYDISIAAILTSIGLMGFDTTLTALVAKGYFRIEAESSLLILMSMVILSFLLILFFNSYSLSILVSGMLSFSWVAADMLGRQQFKKYMLAMTIQRIISLILVPFLLAEYSLDGALLGWGIAYFVLSTRYFESLRTIKFRLYTIGRMRKLFVHSYLLGISKTLPYFVDKLIILPLFGAAIVGYYQLGAQISMITAIIPFVLYSYLLPKESGGTNFMNSHTKQLGIYASVASTIVLFITIPGIIYEFFPNFEEAITPSRIIVFSTLPLSLVAIYNSRFMGSGKSNPVVAGTAIFVSCQISLIYIFGSLYSLEGLSMATVIASILQCCYLYLCTRRHTVQLVKSP
jgi:O-antigen/teichoic acid export membrane protein